MIGAVYIGIVAALLVCCGLCLYRIGCGPSAPDRMVAIDILGTLLVGSIAILTAITGTEYLLNLAIVWALVSFVGTVALAKYLVGRELNE